MTLGYRLAPIYAKQLYQKRQRPGLYVPALGKGASGLAGFYSYSLQSIGNVGKGIYI